MERIRVCSSYVCDSNHPIITPTAVFPFNHGVGNEGQNIHLGFSLCQGENSVEHLLNRIFHILYLLRAV